MAGPSQQGGPGILSTCRGHQARLVSSWDWSMACTCCATADRAQPPHLVAEARAKDELVRPAIRPLERTLPMTRWRRRSRRSSWAPAGRWQWTGRTWSPSPGPCRAAPAYCADPEASWGIRKKSNLLRSETSLSYGINCRPQRHHARRERPRPRPPAGAAPSSCWDYRVRAFGRADPRCPQDDPARRSR